MQTETFKRTLDPGDIEGVLMRVQQQIVGASERHEVLRVYDLRRQRMLRPFQEAAADFAQQIVAHRLLRQVADEGTRTGDYEPSYPTINIDAHNAARPKHIRERA